MWVWYTKCYFKRTLATFNFNKFVGDNSCFTICFIPYLFVLLWRCQWLHDQVDPIFNTRSSAISERPRDASCQVKSCQLPRNSAETTCTTSPEQIEVMKLESYSGTKKVKFSHTRYRALGPELIPVYRQSARRWPEVNHAIYPAVVLPLLSAGPAVTPVAFTRWRYL